MHRRLLANILLVVLPWILAASACDLKKSPGMFTVNFVWPEGVKPSPTLTLYARAVLNWLPDGSQVNDNGEVPLASGTPELTFDGLNYERPYTLTVEIFEKTAQKTQVVYFGKSKEFTLKADKTTIVEVAVPLKPAPGRKNDGTPAPIAPRIAEVRNGVFVTVSNVTIHYHAENAETVSISNEPTFGSGEDFTIGDRTSSGEYSLPWDLNSVLGDTDGQRTVYLKLSNDHAYETDLEAMTVIYDHAAPVVTIDDPKPPQVTNSVSATLLFSCNEDVCVTSQKVVAKRLQIS
ncbi:MAG: hypothetical protein HY897_24450 [Deltaproteobacteria bacterium]|nr:hypothetical protein [Deltaproteobacteria bacterium]